MTDDERAELAAEIAEDKKKSLVAAVADELRDSAGITTEEDCDLVAACVVDRIERTLYQLGWMPPRTYEAVQGWATRTAGIPEHHINQSVLTSHLTELAAILHDRS